MGGALFTAPGISARCFRCGLQVSDGEAVRHRVLEQSRYAVAFAGARLLASRVLLVVLQKITEDLRVHSRDRLCLLSRERAGRARGRASFLMVVFWFSYGSGGGTARGGVALAP